MLVAEAELKELNRKPSSSPKAERKEDVEKRHAGVNEDLVARFGKHTICQHNVPVSLPRNPSPDPRIMIDHSKAVRTRIWLSAGSGHLASGRSPGRSNVSQACRARAR